MLKVLKEVLLDDFWIMPATPKYTNEGIPYITSKNIKNGKIDFENANYINVEDYKKISKNRPILVNDILISMIGTLGEIAIVQESDGIFYGQNMFLIRLDTNKIHQRYFVNYFKSDIVKRQLINKQNKSTQSYLKANHIESLKIPIPDLEKQKQIAYKLDKIKEIIDVRKKQIKDLDEIIKSQFVEMFDNDNCESKGWQDVFNTTTGKLDSNAMVEDGIYPFFTCAKEAFRINEYAFDCEALLLAGNNAAGIYDVKHYKGKFNAYQRTYVLTLKDEKWRYELFKLQLEEKLELLKHQSKGSNTRYLTMKILNDLTFKVPNLNLQNQFAEFVKLIDKQKFEIQKSLDEIQKLQESLMNTYFGG